MIIDGTRHMTTCAAMWSTRSGTAVYLAYATPRRSTPRTFHRMVSTWRHPVGGDLHTRLPHLVPDPRHHNVRVHHAAHSAEMPQSVSPPAVALNPRPDATTIMTSSSSTTTSIDPGVPIGSHRSASRTAGGTR